MFWLQQEPQLIDDAKEQPFSFVRTTPHAQRSATMIGSFDEIATTNCDGRIGTAGTKSLFGLHAKRFSNVKALFEVSVREGDSYAGGFLLPAI